MPHGDILHNEEFSSAFYQQCKWDGEDLVKNMKRW